jgi:hypothetical protein
METSGEDIHFEQETGVVTLSKSKREDSTTRNSEEGEFDYTKEGERTEETEDRGISVSPG